MDEQPSVHKIQLPHPTVFEHRMTKVLDREGLVHSSVLSERTRVKQEKAPSTCRFVVISFFLDNRLVRESPLVVFRLLGRGNVRALREFLDRAVAPESLIFIVQAILRGVGHELSAACDTRVQLVSHIFPLPKCVVVASLILRPRIVWIGCPSLGVMVLLMQLEVFREVSRLKLCRVFKS